MKPTFRRFRWLRLCLHLNPRFLFTVAILASVELVTESLHASPPVRVASGQSFAVAGVIASSVFSDAAPFSARPAAASSVTESDAIAIIGEAGGEPYAGQVAVAAVLRRRNSTKGFYGLKNPVVAKASAKTIARAKQAWADSATTDPSRGATHFENVKAFGVPSWAVGKTPCAEIGNHTFFKL